MFLKTKLLSLIGLIVSVMFLGLGLNATSASAITSHGDFTYGHQAKPGITSVVQGPTSEDDSFTLYAGSGTDLTFDKTNVLANDTDPGGLDLKVCDFVAPYDVDSSVTYAFVDLYDFHLLLYIQSGTKASTFTFPYATCNGTEEVWRNVTITVTPVHRIHFKKLDKRPGFLTTNVNKNAKPVHCLYGSFSEPAPDGAITVKAGTSKTFKVRHPHHQAHRKVDYLCWMTNQYIDAGYGHVRNIVYSVLKLVGLTSSKVRLSSKAMTLWSTAGR